MKPSQNGRTKKEESDVPTKREHFNDEVLLAYLDGEVSNTRMRTIRNHLRTCWKCRSALAEVESQVETVSRLLDQKSKYEAERFIRARQRFLRWRKDFENRQKFFFRCQPHLVVKSIADVVLAWNGAGALRPRPAIATGCARC